MFEPTTFLVAFTVGILAYLWFGRPDADLPPFPVRPLPIVGNLFSMESDVRPLFDKWRKQCGNIFSLYMGGTLLVVVSGYDLIKEMLLKRRDFADRPKIYFDVVTGNTGKGVITSTGHNWREQRSVALQILKDFGMGKNVLADRVQKEIGFFCELLDSLKGHPTDIRTVTNLSLSNVICSIILGQRFSYNDSRLQGLISKFSIAISDQTMAGSINFFPLLRFIPGDPFKGNSIKRNVRELYNFIDDFVNEKLRENVEDNDSHSFITAYIAEEKTRKRKDEGTCLDKDNLVKLVYDLFIAGTETSSTVLTWCLLFFINYPDVQRKVFEELKENVGLDRVPTLQDRTSLPYLGAVIVETMRLGNVVPLAVTHTCANDSEFKGYKIPKGACIIPNLGSVLHDEKVWGEDVMTFRPERHLDEDGKLRTKEEFIPFSVGRRVCLGEAMASTEIFLYLSNIVQRFEFQAEDPDSPPSMISVFGLTVSPQHYKLRAIERLSQM